MISDKFIRFALFIFALFITPQLMSQVTFTVNGNWTKRVWPSKITEAGEDYPNTLNSTDNRSRIKVRKSNLNDIFPWRVDVRGDQVYWDNRLSIWLKRTGDGELLSPTGTITGGTVFQQATSTNQSFFSGSASWRRIPIKYEVRGVTVLIPADTYEMTIVYTLTEL